MSFDLRNMGYNNKFAISPESQQDAHRELLQEHNLKKILSRKKQGTLYAILPELRQKLGRIHITLLLDSLYANEPVIQLAEKLFMNYLIVR